MSVYYQLLKERVDYRYLWYGNVISLLGDWFNLIASATLVGRLTESGMAVSFLFLARFIPLFFGSPIAGVLADRYNRKHLLIISDLLRAVTVLGFLFVDRVEEIPLFYLLTVIQFLLSSLFTPARSAIIANVVSEEELITASALDSVTWSVMFALGALLGGVTAGLFGLRTAFILDSLTFLLSAYVVYLVEDASFKGKEQDIGDGAETGFWDGIVYLGKHQFVIVLIFVKGFGALVWGGVNVLEVVFAEQVFPLDLSGVIDQFNWLAGYEGGTLSLGLIYLMAGFGTGFGPLILRYWFGDEPKRVKQLITFGFIVLGLGVAVMATADQFSLFLWGVLLRTLGSGTVWVFSSALLQLVLPDRVRGRIFAFEFALLTLLQSISIFWAGYAQDQLGWEMGEIMFFFAIFAFPFALLWVVSDWFFKTNRFVSDIGQ